MNEYKDEEAKEKRKKFIRKGKVNYYFSLVRWQNMVYTVINCAGYFRLEIGRA